MAFGAIAKRQTLGKTLLRIGTLKENYWRFSKIWFRGLQFMLRCTIFRPG